MLYKHFNFNLNCILKDKQKSLNKYNKQRQYRLDISDITEDFLSIIRRKNLEIDLIDVFRLDRLQASPIHIDNNHICDFPRINFVYGNQQSPMIWYKVKSKKTLEKELTGYYNQNIMLFDAKEVEEIDKTLIQFPTIIQTGTPHRVTHQGIGTRWAVSFIFTRNSQHLTFDQLCEVFSEYSI